MSDLLRRMAAAWLPLPSAIRGCPSTSFRYLVRANATPSAAVALALASTLGFSLSCVAPSAVGLLATQASASTIFFSTGNPDGKIATLSRPSGTGGIQTETADDFILTQSSVINQATFTGLLPMNAPLTSVSNVEVELYHIVLVERDPRNVPTRVFSPEDNEISSATRDSADGSLSFDVELVNSSFSVLNSVENGIHPSPGQFTGGEGPVTGQEVLITVTFKPPIALPADHFFFRPEVQLSTGDFLWLSAPKPIVAPGTPFANPNDDKQSWIRNDDLAPDWLRIGTDITHQGPFNAAFSLTGETDADGDGVGDSLDLCPDTAPGAVVNADGCSIDQLVPCDGPRTGGTWKNHGTYVAAIAHAANEFLVQGLISGDQKGAIVSNAAQSSCGRK